MIVGLIRCIDHSFPPLPAKTSHPLMSRSDKCGNSLNPTMHYSNMAIKRVMQHSSPLFSVCVRPVWNGDTCNWILSNSTGSATTYFFSRLNWLDLKDSRLVTGDIRYFFHRNATSALPPPSEPEAITLPSRIQTRIFIKILLSIVVFSSSFNSLLPAPSSSQPLHPHSVPPHQHYHSPLA